MIAKNTLILNNLMMDKTPVTAVLVTYNSADVIAQALKPLYGQLPIIVVDNASGDDTCQIIRRDFPQVTLLQNHENEGFGRANNRALESIKTPYALLVNPDAVLQKNTWEALLEAANRYPDAAILAPQLYDEAGNTDHSYKQSVFVREKKRSPFVLPSGDLCAEFLSGAVWFLNMTIMKKIGFFDPNIFLYYEDDDLCLRARKAGYGLVLVHAAGAQHLKGTSSGAVRSEAVFFRQRCMIWSRLYLDEKYFGRKSAKRQAAKLRIYYMFKAIFYAAYCNFRKFNRYRGRLAGITAFISNTKP